MLSRIAQNVFKIALSIFLIAFINFPIKSGLAQEQPEVQTGDFIQGFYGRTRIQNCDETRNDGCVKNLLEKKSCIECNLQNTNLSNISIENANLQKSNFKGSNLENSSLVKANFTDSKIESECFIPAT